jgi:hypothetical protein
MLENIYEKIRRRVILFNDTENSLLSRLFGSTRVKEVRKKGVSLFGAGVVAEEIFRALTNQSITVHRFVVSTKLNKQRHCGLEVVDLFEFTNKHHDEYLLIAVSKGEQEIIKVLGRSGFKIENVIPLRYDLAVSAAISDPTQMTL